MLDKSVCDAQSNKRRMNETGELFDRIAAELRDVGGRLEQLRSSHPNSAALKQALILEKQLSRQVFDTRAKLADSQPIGAEAEALAASIENGMKQMIAIISSDEASSDLRSQPPIKTADRRAD